MLKKLPLSWLQLSYEKTRLITAIAGIAFADILMFVQLGFRNALYESATGPHQSIQGDLVLVDGKYKTLFYMKNFSRTYLYKTLAVNGVDEVSSLYIGSADWINPINHNSRTILVLGFAPTKPVLNFPEVNENLNKLKRIDEVFFDQASRPEYGPVAEYLQEGKGFNAEVNGIRVKVSELFTLGASFTAEGNFITSDLTFFRIFNRDPNKIEVGVINLKPGADIQQVQAQIKQQLPEYLQVLTIEEFANLEKEYWANSTGIGFMFGLGAGMGFIVGAVIVYQILYGDVSDHLPEYATLKAMGYKDSYFLLVVVQESLILSLLGYLPGWLISWGLYVMTRKSTMLPMFMTKELVIFVFLLTILLCIISAMIAIRKLREADPADIY